MRARRVLLVATTLRRVVVMRYTIEADDWHHDSGFTAVKQCQTIEEFVAYSKGAEDMSFQLRDNTTGDLVSVVAIGSTIQYDGREYIVTDFDPVLGGQTKVKDFDTNEVHWVTIDLAAPVCGNCNDTGQYFRTGYGIMDICNDCFDTNHGKPRIRVVSEVK